MITSKRARQKTRDKNGRFAKGRNYIQRENRRCFNCSKLFSVKLNSNQRYCSHNCFLDFVKKRKCENKLKKIREFICLSCGNINKDKSGRRKYCDNAICQKVRSKKARDNFKKIHSNKYLRDRSTEWRRSKGIMSRGGSRYEEQVYKTLLRYFDEKEIQRNVWGIIRNPYTAGHFELDFYIEKFRLAFEVDGESHRLADAYGIKRLNRQIVNDYLKELVCEEKNITLIRIPMGKDINIWGQIGIIKLDNLQKFLWQLRKEVPKLKGIN